MTSFLATPTTGIFDTAERVHANRNLGQREAEARATHRSNILEGYSVRDSRAVTDANTRSITDTNRFNLSQSQIAAQRADAERAAIIQSWGDVGLDPNTFDLPTGPDDVSGQGFTAPPPHIQGAPVLSNAGAPAPDGGVATQPAPTPNAPYTTQIPTQQAGLPPNPNEVLDVSSTGNEPPTPPGVYRGPNLGYINPPPPTTGKAPWRAALDEQNAQPQQSQGLSSAGAPPAPSVVAQQIDESEAVGKARASGDNYRDYASKTYNGMVAQYNRMRQRLSTSTNIRADSESLRAMEQQMLDFQYNAQLTNDAHNTNVRAEQGRMAVDAAWNGDSTAANHIFTGIFGADTQLVVSPNGSAMLHIGGNAQPISRNDADIIIRSGTDQQFVANHAANLKQLSEQELERYKVDAQYKRPGTHILPTGEVLSVVPSGTPGQFTYFLSKVGEDVSGEPTTNLNSIGNVGGGFTTNVSADAYLNLTQ